MVHQGLQFLDIQLQRPIAGDADNLSIRLCNADTDRGGQSESHVRLCAGSHIALLIPDLQCLRSYIIGRTRIGHYDGIMFEMIFQLLDEVVLIDPLFTAGILGQTDRPLFAPLAASSNISS